MSADKSAKETGEEGHDSWPSSSLILVHALLSNSGTLLVGHWPEPYCHAGGPPCHRRHAFETTSLEELAADDPDSHLLSMHPGGRM